MIIEKDKTRFFLRISLRILLRVLLGIFLGVPCVRSGDKRGAVVGSEGKVSEGG
jgi:hypothetical protein